MAVALKRRLQEEDYYVDAVSGSIGSGVPGVRVFEMKNHDHRLARYVKESMANVVVYIGDRSPDIDLRTTVTFRGKTGDISILANEEMSDPQVLADVCRIAEELANA